MRWLGHKSFGDAKGYNEDAGRSSSTDFDTIITSSSVTISGKLVKWSGCMAGPNETNGRSERNYLS